MGDKIKNNKYMTLLLIVGAVYFFLKFICPLVAPVLIAVLFLISANPVLDKLQKKTRIRKNFWAAVWLLVVCLMIGAVLWLSGSLFIHRIPEWIRQMDVVENQFCCFVRMCCETVETRFGVDAVSMENMILEQVTVFIDKLQLQVFPGMLEKSIEYAKNLMSMAGFLVAMVIATVLLAKDYDKIMAKIQEQEEFRVVLKLAEGVIQYIVIFVKAQIVIMILIGVTIGTVLFCFQIGNGILVGAAAGFLDVLPFIGTGVVLIPMALWQLINGFYGKAAVCVILYVVCILIRECLEPKLIGEKIGVYPIAVLISVYAGLRLFGIWGIFKGPLGFVMIEQAYRTLRGRRD